MKDVKSLTLERITFKVKQNQLLVIIGPTGCRKSSILMAIANEMPIISGDIKLNGRIYYVSQEAWIFPASIRQNILFGMEYIKDKFDKVIKACALDQVTTIKTKYFSYILRKIDFKFYPIIGYKII